MSLLEQKTQAVVNDLPPNVKQLATIDPAVLAMIMQIIMQVIQAFSNCQKPAAELPTMASNPGLLGRFRLRQIVRCNINDDEMHSVAGPALCKSILKVGAALTPDEARELSGET